MRLGLVISHSRFLHFVKSNMLCEQFIRHVVDTRRWSGDNASSPSSANTFVILPHFHFNGKRLVIIIINIHMNEINACAAVNRSKVLECRRLLIISIPGINRWTCTYLYTKMMCVPNHVSWKNTAHRICGKHEIPSLYALLYLYWCSDDNSCASMTPDHIGMASVDAKRYLKVIDTFIMRFYLPAYLHRITNVQRTL